MPPKSFFGKMSKRIPRFHKPGKRVARKRPRPEPQPQVEPVHSFSPPPSFSSSSSQPPQQQLPPTKRPKKPTFQFQVIEIHYYQSHIWLFGVNEAWTKGSNLPRSVSVKVPFSQHIVYDGPMDDMEIDEIRCVTKIQHDTYKKLCMYDGNKTKSMRRIYFQQTGQKKMLINRLKRDDVGKVYNESIDPVIQFVHETGCQFFRVAEITNARAVRKCNQETINDLELICPTDQIRGLEGSDALPNSSLRVCDFDIETLNLDPNPITEDNDVPDPTQNQVITVCVSLHDMGDVKNVRRVALILDPNTNPESKRQIEDFLDEKDSWGIEEFEEEGKVKGEVRTFATEAALLAMAQKIILQADVVTGWNSIAFDLNYLFVRGQVLRRPKLTHYTKFKKREAIQKQTFHGDSYILTPGLIQHDAQKACQIQTGGRLESYKLTEVSQKYIKKRKKDLPWQLIEPFFREGTIGRAKVADYCIWDVDLVTLLCNDRDYFLSVAALSTMCSVDMTQILMRGQQLRVFQVLTLEILKEKYVMNKDDLDRALRFFKPKIQEKKKNKYEDINPMTSFFEEQEQKEQQEEPIRRNLKPTRKKRQRPGQSDRISKQKQPPKKKARQKKYEGGYVITPVPGRYKNVTVIDYHALYPSIIIAYNLCFRNLITDKAKANRLIAQGRDVFFMSEQPTAFCAFLMDAKDTLFPDVLRRLLAERKRVKGLKKDAIKNGDDKAAKIYDALQLAIKVVCNSCYGFVGADTEKGAKFPCLPIAVTITYIGRSLIKRLQEYIPKKYPHLKVVYGDTDSVFVKWPDEMTPDEIEVAASKLADELNQLDMHRGYLELEYESLFINALLCKRKMYAAGKFQGQGKPLKAYFKGLSAIRRDNCDWGRNTMNEFLESLLVKPKPTEELMDELKENLHNIEKADLHDFSITCRVNKEYKNRNLIQCKVIDEVRKRLDCHDAVKVGDRIRYVVRDGVKSKKLSDWGLEYEHAREIGAKPNYRHYLKKIKKPLSAITGILGPKYEKRFQRDFNEINGKILRKKQGVRSIEDFCVR